MAWEPSSRAEPRPRTGRSTSSSATRTGRPFPARHPSPKRSPAPTTRAGQPPTTEVETTDSGTELRPVPGAEFAEIPLDQIRPNPRQPRTVFDEDELGELVNSIREIGVLQPVVVRRVPEGTQDGEVRYELIMGERRWRASRAAGKDVVPAIIKVTEEDDLLRDALLENLHRSQLNALEEAAAYQQLLDDFGCTQEELGRRIHRSRPQISNTLRLLKLPPLVQRRVAAGVLSAGHARALLGLPDAAAMERMAQRIVAEGLSVRTVEELVTLGDDDTPGDPPRAARRHPPTAARRPGSGPVGPAGDPGADRPGSAQGPPHGGVRLGRGPQPHPRRDAPARGPRGLTRPTSPARDAASAVHDKRRGTCCDTTGSAPPWVVQLTTEWRYGSSSRSSFGFGIAPMIVLTISPLR